MKNTNDGSDLPTMADQKLCCKERNSLRELLFPDPPDFQSKLTELDREYLSSLSNVYEILCHIVLALNLCGLLHDWERFPVWQDLHDDDDRISTIAQCLNAIRNT